MENIRYQTRINLDVFALRLELGTRINQYMSRATRKKYLQGKYGQRMPRIACAFTQANQDLRCPLTGSIDTCTIKLSTEQMPGRICAHAQDDLNLHILLRFEGILSFDFTFRQYEGPAKSFVTGFGLLQCYVLSNIFSLQTFKVFPFLLKHIFISFLPSREKQINSLLLVSVADTDKERCQEN